MEPEVLVEALKHRPQMTLLVASSPVVSGCEDPRKDGDDNRFGDGWGAVRAVRRWGFREARRLGARAAATRDVETSGITCGYDATLGQR